MKQGFLALIWVYQRLFRPYLPCRCRFYPSCSDYAIQALTDYGVGKGLWLICRRLLRCHPWAKAGVDLLP